MPPVKRYENGYGAGMDNFRQNLGESVSEIVLCPVATSFTEGSRWQFHDGDNSLTAVIEDPRFRRAVERGEERFARNDLLRVRLRSSSALTVKVDPVIKASERGGIKE